MVKGAAALAIAALSGLEFGRRLYRDSRLFCPQREPLVSWNPSDYGFTEDTVDEVEFELDGNRLFGWYCRADYPIASALYCHGNATNLTLDLPAIRRFVRAGISVLTFDYRGYGRSDGRPGLRGVVRDAVAAASIHDNLRPLGIPSILYGFSLGGAIAARVAERMRFDALVLQSTFTCLREIVRVIHPSVPLHLLCAGELDTAAIVEKLDVPTLVIHGRDDEVVPCSMGEELFRRAKNPWRFVDVADGAHGNVCEVDGEIVVDAVRELAIDLGGEPPVAIAS